MAMLGEKLLVIGDEGLAQRVASLEPGYQVKTIPREQVLEVAQKEPFDLVIGGQENLTLVKALISRYAYLGALLLGEARESPPPGCLIFPARLSDEELQAALEEALERRRLLRENQHLQALLPLFDINRALFSDTDLDTLPHTLLQIVWSEVRADKAALFLWEGEGPVLHAQIGGNELSPDMAMRAAEGRQPLHVSPDGTGSLLSLPLVARGKALAFLQVSRATAFSTWELSFLAILSSQAAIAMENAILIRDLSEQQKRVEYLLGQNILAQEKERRRISLELHDTVAQRLVGACHCLQGLEGQRSGEQREALKEVRDSLALGLKELRWAIESLQPSTMEGGLVETLRRFGQAFCGETALSFSLEVEGEPARLSPLLETSAFRVAQEALTNVHKHAHATSVQMRLCFEGQGLTLKIEDDGQGFDPRQVLAQDGPSHLGLDGMRERAQALGGKVEILSRPGEGTQIVLHLPVEGVENGHPGNAGR
jgi:signal transduction histidine kinase